MGKLSPSRLAEFFEGDNGRLSMTRLVVFLTWPPSTWVVIHKPDQLSNYLGAYVISYALGKGADIFMGGKNANVDEPDNSGDDIGGDMDAREPDSQPQVRARKANRNSRGGKAK